MNEPDLVFSVCWAGFGAACVAALPYFTTSGGEPSGFRVPPTTASGWVGFYFRTLILVCILSMLFGLAPYIHPIVRSAWGVSAFLLFVSSAAFWRSDRALCSIGFILSGVSVLWALLFPVISTGLTTSMLTLLVGTKPHAMIGIGVASLRAEDAGNPVPWNSLPPERKALAEGECDADPRTWERRRARLKLPPDTVALVAQLQVGMATKETAPGALPGQFADNVAVTLLLPHLPSR